VATLFGRAPEDRRPRFSRSTAKRAEALRALHARQIALLARWRGLRDADERSAADAVLLDLLQTVNAIAGGLRTTG
jgi:phosphoenolpyruvate carboxylase